VDQKLTAAQRLQHVQRVILDELTWAKQQAKQPGTDRAGLSDVIVKLSTEVRLQLRLEHDISRTLIDLRVVREFQRTVFQAISEESPETARRIVAKLKEQQELRRAQNYPRSMAVGVSMWRDPLDELIEDLEHAWPAHATALINEMPSCDDFQIFVAASLCSSDQERQRLEVRSGPHSGRKNRDQRRVQMSSLVRTGRERST